MVIAILITAMAGQSMPVGQKSAGKKVMPTALRSDTDSIQPTWTEILVPEPEDSFTTIDIISMDDESSTEMDTTQMDSIQLSIYRYNKHIDDSIYQDSLNRAKSSGIDAPVKYSAQDSLVYDAKSKGAYLYGSAKA